ncbi:DoxX family protein [Rhizobium sp. P38BS-XIX]|uniref:DoxX family protein n=1 Tax=Rhizobium sp. P38BS-XIX TaxID=2726740 RepID=UPI0014569F5E|nr:DoxX family protein [Rhizobium sp. P38BS-XIX]NLR95883.1 DoxX family protein [Rhizobium sp. P38BS-XIX]
MAGSANSRTGAIVGWILSAIVFVALAADAAVDLFAPSLVGAEMNATGFPPGLTTLLGLIILVCAVLYAIPQTAVLGAILATGFLGGAICTHFRLGEVGSPPQLISLLLGVLAWGGLYLRDSRIRDLLPIMKSTG